jgi:hypothetical protein
MLIYPFRYATFSQVKIATAVMGRILELHVSNPQLVSAFGALSTRVKENMDLDNMILEGQQSALALIQTLSIKVEAELKEIRALVNPPIRTSQMKRRRVESNKRDKVPASNAAGPSQEPPMAAEYEAPMAALSLVELLRRGKSGFEGMLCMSWLSFMRAFTFYT